MLGAGSWGTTLALLLHRSGHGIRLWEFDPDQVEAMTRSRVNVKFLPGKPIPEAIEITGDVAYAVNGSDAIVFAVPSHAVRDVAGSVRAHAPENALVVCVSKGIENETLMRMSEVLSEQLGRPKARRMAMLVGPSHAEEVSDRIPTTVVAASRDESTAIETRDLFMDEFFRVYTNTDLVGVEVAVALKNIIAIAAGICDGLGYGDNTKGALLTRGLAEITRLGIAMGGRPETFAGLSGMGDMITTCISRHSRNRYVGEQIAGGKTLAEVLSSMVMVAEGVRTTRSAVALATEYDVEMPITEQMYLVLFEDKNPRVAIRDLMMREPKPEAIPRT
jgi:glycerol-3-phosphate dehydrogenase (NAD(P)+)